MATKTQFEPLVRGVVDAFGGPDNIHSVTHCATRLRFVVKDAVKADIKKAEAVDGVITAIKSGGQHQVVVGNDVPLAYQELMTIPGMAPKGLLNRDSSAEQAEAAGNGEKKNLLDRFIDMISAIITPLIWALAGIALGKAFLTLALNFGWLDAESTTAVILSVTFDGLFYFLPLFLAVTAARKFNANEFIAMAIAAALVHPDLIALNQGDGDVSFFSLPVVLMSYASSVIPIIVAVWIQGYVERWFRRILPGAFRNFGTPLFTVAIMVPLTLMTVGPLTVLAANAVSDGVGWLFATVPWLAGAVLGAFWQVFVMFGLHWGFVPIMLNDLANQGFTYFTAPLMAAVLAQAGVAAAVGLRTRNSARRKIAGPAAVSAFLAGVTEPAVYGVNLPLKYPFYIGIGAGAIGGAIIGAGRSAFDAFVFPSVIAFPAGMNHGSFSLLVIGTVVAVILGFVVTWLAVPWIERKAGETVTSPVVPEPQVRQEEAGAVDPTTVVLTPVAGRIIPLSAVKDKVFASGSMGTGVAVEPSNGEILAPVSGRIIAVPKTGHAYGIKTDDGVEVLVHVGIDTVQMKGEGFAPTVSRGDYVTAGQIIGTANLAAISQAGFPATTIVVVTNTAKLGHVAPVMDTGEVTKGTTVLTVSRLIHPEDETVPEAEIKE